MKQKTTANIFRVSKNYANKWIALSPDYKRVVSSGLTLEEAESKLKAEEKDRVIFYKVIPPTYVPANS